MIGLALDVLHCLPGEAMERLRRHPADVEAIQAYWTLRDMEERERKRTAALQAALRQAHGPGRTVRGRSRS